ncbi:hypothetical protein [Allofournierella massiliensis]|uniref:hypothetical protein n=1 Tax=Allofournierella massiliensis TaxID=1650663 RepID=UPI003561F4CE
MPLSAGTTIGRTPADRCPGSCSDAAFFRYDHRSYPRQTTARAAAQMLLSSGTTIGRTPGRPLPEPLLRCRFPQVRPSVVPRQTTARAAAQMLLSSGTTIGRTPADHCPGRCLDAAFRRYDRWSYLFLFPSSKGVLL